jgi:hypothetical protein
MYYHVIIDFQFHVIINNNQPMIVLHKIIKLNFAVKIFCRVKKMVKMYKIGVCFGCQKCLYCGIDLKVETCNCKKTVKPSRKNRTVLVKHAYSRVFDPISNPKQFDFIKIKNESFDYGYNLAKSFQFSFCSTCNSSYQRLADKKSKSSNNPLHTSKYISQLVEETGIIDLEATSSEISHETTTSNTSSFHNGSKHSNSETEDENNSDLEIEINYKLSIKQADGTFLPAKNYSVTISELDELLLAIQNNVTILLKDDEINANDYSVSFKSEKAQGAGTLLVDVRDFENFKSEYIKIVTTKRTMLIFITMKKKEKLVINTKRKKKVILSYYYFIIFFKKLTIFF